MCLFTVQHSDAQWASFGLVWNVAGWFEERLKEAEDGRVKEKVFTEEHYWTPRIPASSKCMTNEGNQDGSWQQY